MSEPVTVAGREYLATFLGHDHDLVRMQICRVEAEATTALRQENEKLRDALIRVADLDCAYDFEPGGCAEWARWSTARLVRRLHRPRSPGDQMNADLRAAIEARVASDLAGPILAALDAAEQERDKARDGYRWMVEHAADNKLDGYRELGTRAANAEARADAAEAQVATLFAEDIEPCRKGCFSGGCGPCWATGCDHHGALVAALATQGGTQEYVARLQADARAAALSVERIAEAIKRTFASPMSFQAATDEWAASKAAALLAALKGDSE